MPELTPQTIVAHIRQSHDTLSTILAPSMFCEPGKLGDAIAVTLMEKLKPTQLRKVFNPIKQIGRQLNVAGLKSSDPIPTDQRSSILMLLPPLAYARGRDLIPEEFYQLLVVCLDSNKLKTVADFNRLDEFLTAILAYHKYHEKISKKGA